MWRAILLGLVMLAGARPCAAQTIEYSAIDRATVRVFALRGIEMIPVKAKKTGATHRIASAIGGHGSGVLVSKQGLIATAHHVVEGARLIAVMLPGSAQAVPAEIVHVSPRSDLAFLVIAGEHPGFVSLPSKPPVLQARQTVYALGYPLDGARSDPQSSRGIVSGSPEPGQLQLAISVNPGNSGGPVIDEKNELLGIVVRSADPKRGAQGLAIAVAIDRVLEVQSKGVTPERLASARKRVQGLPREARATSELVAHFAQRWDLIEEIIDAMDEGSMAKLRAPIQAVQEDPGVKADALALVGAYYWNESVVRYVLREGDWAKLQRIASSVCAKALKLDAAVGVRSPFVTRAVGTGSAADEHNADSRARENLQDSRGVPKAAPPRAPFGFRLGSSVEATKALCEKAGHEFGADGKGYRCSGPVQELKYPAWVELRFCQAALCRVDLLTRPSKGLSQPWLERLGAFKRFYEDRYGVAKPDLVRIPDDCRSRILPCLSAGRAAVRYLWTWPEHEISVAMGRYRGQPAVQISFAARAAQ